MEQLNKIELRGILGMIRLQNVGGSSYASMSIATNYAYKSKDGCAVIETTWHNVVAWEGQAICDLSTLQKGDTVHVIGRLRCKRYTDAADIDRTCYDVVANTLEKS